MTSPSSQNYDEIELQETQVERPTFHRSQYGNATEMRRAERNWRIDRRKCYRIAAITLGVCVGIFIISTIYLLIELFRKHYHDGKTNKDDC